MLLFRLLKLAASGRNFWRHATSRRLLLLVLIGIVISAADYSSIQAIGAENASRSNSVDESEPEDEEDDNDDEDSNKIEVTSSSSSRSPSDLQGITGRFGHIAFPTFGRNDSITNVELMPYVISDDNMFFGNMRLFLDNQAQFGGNGGLGFRHWVPEWERLFGASLWYDYDETSGKSFHGGGVSLETYGGIWDFRTNGYIPIDDREKDFVKGLANIRFAGNQILFDHLRTFAEAQAGFDLELGLAVPSQFANTHKLRVAGGYYHFFGDAVPEITGLKGRIEGSLTDNIDMQVEVTDDDTFGTNVSLGVAISFGAPAQTTSRPNAKLRQMSRSVNRNYNIIVTRQDDNQYALPAINPADGQPYTVQHVATAAAGPGSGTIGDPFSTIAAAQATGSDIVFVHSGSVIVDPVVLNAQQRVLGEGVDHLINIPTFGDIFIPMATGGTTVPLLQGIAGNAVTLASAAEFSGFNINGPTGHGIFGDGINGAITRHVTVHNAGGDGIFLNNPMGTIAFHDTSIAGITGAAFHIDGGNADVRMSGSINNVAGRSVVIENNINAVHLEETEIIDNGGTGILVDNNNGNVDFGNVDSQNSTATGIDIQGGGGTTQFTGQTTVVNSTGPGINIENMTGSAHFGDVSVMNTTGAQGVHVENSAGTTSIANLNVANDGGTGLFALNSGNIGVSAGNISATNATAVDIENTAMGIELTSVTSTNNVNGIRIINSPGMFVVRGDGGDGSGGLIQGNTVGILIEDSGTVALQHIHVNNNTTGLMASNSELVAFQSGRVTNSGGRGIDLLNINRFELVSNTLTGNVGETFRSQFDVVGSYSHMINSNTVNDATTSPFTIATLAAANGSTLSLNMDSNSIVMGANGSQAVDLDWNGALVSTFTNNGVTATGTTSRGFDINTSSATHLAQITADRNALSFAGADSTGMQITTAGPSEISLQTNAMVFNAANGIGVDFTIGESSNITIFDNRIRDNVSSGTGLLFSAINGTSNVAINSNVLELFSPDALVDRGIIFTNVTGTVTIGGTQNNTVSGATTAFSGTGTTGQIIVNGVAVP